MRLRGDPPVHRHRRGGAFLLLLLLVAASARLYGALLVLYPKAFRHRYEAEMRRDFRELMREGLEEGGATELVRVCAQAFSDLVLTALEEGGIMPARLAYYLSVNPRKAASAMVVVVVCAAWAVTAASLWHAPTYEASAQVWVDQQQKAQQTKWSGTVEGLQTIIITMIHAIDSRPVAEEVIQRLGLEMSPAELLDNLTIEQVESTSFIVLTYKGTDPQEAQQIVNTLGKVSSELISERSARSPSSRLTATLYEPAVVPESPVSPDPVRNGILAALFGLMLGIGLALLMEYLDRSWRSPEEVEQVSGVPTFATIPEFSLTRSKKEKKTLA